VLNPPAIAPGSKVRLTAPENPRHPRRGRVGVVREASLYQPPKPRNGAPEPPARVWLWVDFPGCPLNGSKPFGSPLWGSEVTPIDTP
jgi:hypothetical protein